MTITSNIMYKLELNQEEFNTLTMALGCISQSRIEEKSEEYEVDILDNTGSQKLYDILKTNLI